MVLGFRRIITLSCELVEQDLKVCVHLLGSIRPRSQVYIKYADVDQLGET